MAAGSDSPRHRHQIGENATKFLMRISDEQLSDIKRAAAIENISASEFVRRAAAARIHEMGLIAEPQFA